MNCKECEYCECKGRAAFQSGNGYPRKIYYCNNPKVREIKDRYGHPLNNFVGYGDSTRESPLQLKTRKRWCLLESEGKNNVGRMDEHF